MRIRVRRILQLFLMPLVFTGCHDNLFLEKDGGVGDITFRVSTAQMKATAQSGVTTRATRTVAGHAVYLSKVSASDINLHRATDASLTTRGEMVTDDNFYDSFHVLGYAFASDDDTQPKLFLNDDIKKDNNWTATELWPDAGSYDHTQFYALAPYDSQVTNLETQTDGSMPSFTYTVPKTISEQHDLLAAVQTVGANRVEGSAVDMKFYHLLTAVDVVLGQMPDGVTVKSVSISGVADKGTFANSAWTPSTTTGSFSTTGLAVDAANNQNVSLLYGKGTYLMMIPQMVPAGAKLSVNVDVAESNKTSNYTLSTSIAGDKWQMGHTYTYTISTSAVGKGYILTVSPENSELGGTEEGTSTVVKMLSYSYYKGNDETSPNSVDVYAEYQVWDDNASTWGAWSKTPPSWLTSNLFNSSNGYQVFTSKQGDSKKTVDLTFTVSTPTAVTGKHSDNINASVLPDDYYSNQESWWDLSQNSKVSSSKGDWEKTNNTANCYIVSHPGRYVFPLVYGNSLKNGQNNTAAYSGMVDAGGNKITDLWALKGTVNKIAVLWKDPSDKDWIRTTGDGLTPSYTKKCGCFEIVPKAEVSGGNAVIAAYDSNGTIVWSWHIWLLDTKDLFGNSTLQDITVTNAAGSQITLMPVNLGWMPTQDKYTFYPRQRVRVRLTQATNGDPANNLQAKGGQTAMFTIDQHAQYDEASTEGYCPYYQWGRKDPMLNAVKDETDKKHSWFFMPYSISNPNHFFTNWVNNIFTSWNNATEPAYTKTIYDPCPAGYHVPRSFAFTGFTADGTESSTTNPANIWSRDSHGVAFYGDRQNDSKRATIYFPVIDWLDNTETPLGGSIYWTSLLTSFTDEKKHPTFMFIGNAVDPQIKGFVFYGGYVRPEKE
jgi:hypothetical protein